ncbi:hypothetical protein ACIPJO_37120, partial [Streptomyces sp. NPDC086993]|uniref:hypothetical protein n=1 Tax=Streptomyces sp. NPDC086993 TaxID=3365765 RepID=UPI0038166157
MTTTDRPRAGDRGPTRGRLAGPPPYPPAAGAHRAVVLAGDRTQTLDALAALAAGADHPAVVT